MSTSPIKLEPRWGATDPAHLEALPGGDIFACDFAVNGAETWTEMPDGFGNGRILNIDHHARVARMYCPITSTDLAVAHVRAVGRARPDDLVVIDHTDCDSILSAGIVSGRLDPLDSLAAAAIAADHTGAEHGGADLLQAIKYRRDVELSFRALEQWLDAGTVLPELRADVEKRRREREQARALVQGDHVVGNKDLGFAWVRNEGNVDAALLLGALPAATLILATRSFPGHPGRWECKLRLGAVAPTGLTLFDLQDRDPELSFGGRWNAGSNEYGHGGQLAGTALSPERYASELEARLAGALASMIRA